MAKQTDPVRGEGEDSGSPARRNAGHRFPAGTRVMTPGGWQDVATLGRGDTVLSCDPVSRRLVLVQVLRIRRQSGPVPLWHLALEGGQVPLRTSRAAVAPDAAPVTSERLVRPVPSRRGASNSARRRGCGVDAAVAMATVTVRSGPVRSVVMPG